MLNPMPSPNPEIFTSWKEIACYLNKGVRTVQRWEAEFGLPVRRPNEREKGIVYALRTELDRWMNSKWSGRASRAADEASVHTEAHRKLRTENKKLMSEISASLSKLQTECVSLAKTIEDSRVRDTNVPRA